MAKTTNRQNGYEFEKLIKKVDNTSESNVLKIKLVLLKSTKDGRS